MSKISTYPSADVPLQLSDRLIGTEAIRPVPSPTPLATKNFSLGELLQLFSSNFPAATLQAVLNAGNIATQNITLTGTITATLIKPINIEDTSGSQGLPFQVLSKGAVSITWVDVPNASGYVPISRELTINGITYDLSADRSWTVSAPTPTLQEVTDVGNTTTNTIEHNNGSNLKATLSNDGATALLSFYDSTYFASAEQGVYAGYGFELGDEFGQSAGISALVQYGSGFIGFKFSRGLSTAVIMLQPNYGDFIGDSISLYLPKGYPILGAPVIPISVNGNFADDYGNITISAGGTTDLAYTPSPTNGIVTSSTGTDATLPLADATDAGLLKPADFTQLSTLATDLANKVDENTAITGATKTKITYDAKGLVTAGADATTADIVDSTNKRYQTDAQQTNNDATSSIQTQLDARTRELLQNFTDYTTTGVLTEQIISNQAISANDMKINSWLNFISTFSRTGTTNATVSIYLNTTSNSLVGAVRIALAVMGSTGSLSCFKRDFSINASSVLRGINFVGNFATDEVSNATQSTTTLTLGSAYYLISTATLNNVADTVTQRAINLKSSR